MARILWIMNKYVGAEKSEEFYPYFLFYTQNGLEKEGHKLYFVFFSDLLANNELLKNKFVFRREDFHHLAPDEIEKEAGRIETEYHFTFKQACFADIVQTFKGQNERKITVPKKNFTDLSYLIPRFLFLEELITTNDIDVIFSDVSPETEMEFGRVIGNRFSKIVLKANEGSALGKTVLLRSLGFGKDQLVETPFNQYTIKEAEKFCNDFILNRRLPYVIPGRNYHNKTIGDRIRDRFKKKEYFYFLSWIFKRIKAQLTLVYYFVERNLLKPLLYEKFDPNVPYLFIGFHLNQESTMVLRAQPYTNQTVLVEMLSRVLPYKYVLYVRAHPHWPDRYSYKYLATMKKFPGVKLISEKISVHDVIKNSKGIITYNATTGIEALIYGKPVLSFAPNIYYKQHPAVDYCSDLFELGSKLVSLVNTTVNLEDTFSYIAKINRISFGFLLGADFFVSEEDAKGKAKVFSDFLHKSISWCNDNKY